MRDILAAAAFVALLATSGCVRTRPKLVIAASAGDLSTVELLLRSGADPNVCPTLGGVTPFSPLTAAAANGNVQVVDALIRAGAAVDRPCGVERPMDVAVGNGRVEVVKHLLAAGADTAARTNGGWTYLMEAAVAAQGDVVPVLVAAGCPLEATRPAVREVSDDAEGQTALMIAAGWDPKPTRALIAAGANVNARDLKGASPLIHAIKGAIWISRNGETTPGHWDVSIVKMLLAAGADPNQANVAKETPLLLATQAGSNAEILHHLLLAAGARQASN